MKPIAIATFGTQTDANATITDLRAKGVSDDHITWMGRDSDGGIPGVGQGIDGDTDRFIDKAGDQQLTDQGQQNAAKGLITGGVLGGIIGVALLAIPGFGPLAAAGAFLASGVTLGASLGGITEILTKHGIDTKDATEIENRIKAGDIAVAVDDATGIDADTIIDIMTRHGGMIMTRQAMPA